mgnify:CR=1 FL=1
MTTREEVLATLRNHTTRRIRFQFPMVNIGGRPLGNITVNQTTFDRVAAAIESGAIVVDDTSPLPAGVNASYSDGTGRGGRMTVRRNVSHSRHWSAVVVHESVHASLDLTRSRFSEVDTETAAFLASSMYMVATGMPLHRFTGTYELELRSISFNALRTGNVPVTAIERLRQILRADRYNGGIMTDASGNWTASQGNG